MIEKRDNMVEESKKKSYSKPILEDIGKVAELTKSTAEGDFADGAGFVAPISQG